ncbi:MAG: EI24 domain-containing protein [Thiomicrospira sp.]|jgi:hypothetical protein|nr:EI24 domain-containing protein [Thiomicrospira sp.]
MWDLLFKTAMSFRDAKLWLWLMLPFVLAMVLVSLLGYGSIAYVLNSDWLLSSAWFVEVNQQVDEVESWLLGVPLIGAGLVWFFTLLFGVIIGLVTLILGSYLVLLFAMFITGFLTDILIKTVRNKDYPGVIYQGHGSVWGMLLKVGGYGLGLLLLFILTLPILLIPLVNIVWFWMLGFLFFRYVMVLDVGQVLLSHPQHQASKSFQNWTPTLTLGVLYSLTLLPFVSFFVPVWAVIALAHYHLARLQAESGEVLVKEMSTS